MLLEGRPARWRVSLDLVFGARAADSTVIADGGPLMLNLSQTNLILSPRIGYAVMERPNGSLILTAALRYWSMDAEVTSSLPMSEFRMKGWTKWLDGAFGFEASATPLPRVNLFAQGDLGGGGSRSTWQLWGGIAVDPAAWCAVTLSYRHLDVNYQEMVVYDGHLSGPTLGFAFHF